MIFISPTTAGIVGISLVVLLGSVYVSESSIFFLNRLT